MKKYKLLFSILNYKGKEVAVGLRDWAQLTFSDEEFKKYLEDMQPVEDYFKKLEDAGIRKVTKIYEEANIDGVKTEVLIGAILEYKIDIKMPPVLEHYRNKFRADPNVVKFAEIEEIVEEPSFYPHFSPNLGQLVYIMNPNQIFHY